MKYLTLSQISKKIGGRARSSIYLDIAAGRLPKPKKLGGRLYFLEEEIDAWMRDPEQGAA